MTRQRSGLRKDRSARRFSCDLDRGDAQHMPLAVEILLPLQHPARRDGAVTRFGRRSTVERDRGVRRCVGVGGQAIRRVRFDAVPRPEQTKVLFKNRERMAGITGAADVQRGLGRDHGEHVVDATVFSSVNERLGRGSCFFGGRCHDGAKDQNTDARDEDKYARQRPSIVIALESNPHHRDANRNEGSTQEERIFKDVSADHGAYGIEVGALS